MLNADFLDLPPRSAKPREVGITMVMDRGLSHGELADLVEAACPYVDYVKFGWCTGLLIPCLKEKLDLLRRHDIGFWFGGTLFEAAYAQNRVDRLVGWFDEMGVDLIEISDDSIQIPEPEKLALIESLSKDFRVLSEVGSKDIETEIAPSQWILHMKQELAAGAFMVVAEGREMGQAGIYRPTGEIRMGLIAEMVTEEDLDLRRVIFEAPKRTQQAWFIRELGSDVNLGNIRPDDVIALETLRLSLRYDTIDLLPAPRNVDESAAR